MARIAADQGQSIGHGDGGNLQTWATLGRAIPPLFNLYHLKQKRGRMLYRILPLFCSVELKPYF